METIQEILATFGVQSIEQMDVNESYTVAVSGYDDLAIEKVGRQRISVAHHYVRRCDLMCDPEIVFRVEGGDWIPIEYTQHPRVYRRDEDGLPLSGFIERWDRNLRQQGFVEAAGK
ncbi:DUF6908 domain-containing protein [Halobellus sp. GM3]|uniref:DUF6908 domain-containing protein n=1 Tax=Halobellus sp. GM3 TaxID=3458410 RepID=UPI00403DAF4F